jgi:hypothetical protein
MLLTTTGRDVTIQYVLTMTEGAMPQYSSHSNKRNDSGRFSNCQEGVYHNMLSHDWKKGCHTMLLTVTEGDMLQ